VTHSTADIGPIEQAAALTDLIEQIRAEMRHLTAWRTQKLAEARATSTTVAEIAEQVRLSRGRVSQVTNVTAATPKRRGRHVEPGRSQKGAARVQTPAPQNLTTSQEA
jgi:hypothetical protein